MKAARLLGIARSLAIYYGVPFRARRLAHFYAEFVAPGSLCFDVGAHAGNRIRCWRALGARVVAVEPQRDFVALLKLLFSRDPNVTLVATALGRARGTATLLVSERTPTVTTLSDAWVERVQNDPGFARVAWENREQVEVTTLDELIERHGMPQFVKIDVEGYEAEVLAGLTRAVASLSFEYLPAAREIALECVDRLAALGRYQFNWSEGESHRLAAHEWLDAAAIRRFLVELPANAASGDVYARLGTCRFFKK